MGRAYRVAVDIGGTFTDLVSLEENTDSVLLAKDSTTPDDLSSGVLRTLQKSGIDLADVHQFVHGSTVIINALIERKGAPTALLTTKGFRDVLEIGRGNRPDMYNSLYEKPAPFIERRFRFEVDERLDFQGIELRPVNREDVGKAAERCRHEGITSVAICFLHSYADPVHERQAREILREVFAAASVTMSHELTREWREFERTSTTVLNAYVRPTAQRYLAMLERQLEHLGLRGVKHAMQSNGGVTTFARAMESPIQLVESGPVGGVIGAAALGAAIAESNIISLDIGGTTAKASLIENGEVKINTDYRVEANPLSPGYPVKVPVVDIVEIGAGGGSIARLDPGGSIRVGPDSAGAVPGPACYGLGGSEPTLTDANVVVGRINPAYFLGGEITIDVRRAAEAIALLARRLGLSERETALGIIRIANNNMMNALRMVSIRRGHDPRDFTMVVMGGGSGLHAAFLSRDLGVRKAIVPRAPAHFSAWGMLMTDLRHDYIVTKVLRWSSEALPMINAAFESMEREAVSQLSTEGIEASQVAMFRFVDMRYDGQEHTVKVPVPVARIADEEVRQVERQFHELHESRFTFRLEDPVEAVNFHAMALGTLRKPTLRQLNSGDSGIHRAFKTRREVDFDAQGVLETPVFERDRLPPGARITGPAVVEEPASTTVVPPGMRLEVDSFGNLVIESEA